MTATLPDDPALVDAATMLTALAGAAYQTALDKGWYDEPASFGDRIALIHSEASEALDEYRSGHALTEVYFNEDKPGKPEGVPPELADIIIRVLDLAGGAGIDIGAAVAQKMAYNRTRSYRHGGKVL